MTARTVETLAWVLIYSGLLLACLGWFVQRPHDAAGDGLGWTLLVVGILDAAAGVFLIWWRSRMRDAESSNNEGDRR